MSEMSDRDPGTENGTTDTSGMNDEAFRLDGNAAAGVLAEVFALEMTSAQGTCAHCNRTGPIGSLMLYGGQMGTVLRCPTCSHVQMRLVRVPEQGGQYWIEMRGLSRLLCTSATHT